MYVFSVYACMCFLCVLGAGGGQKEVSYLLELELHMVMALGVEPGSLGRAVSVLN